MQVYKTFMKIGKAKLRVSMIYFTIFMILCILMGFAAESNNESSFQVSSVDICIIDHDNSTTSRALSDYLTSIHHPVTLDSYDNETLQDNLYYEWIDYVLIIPEGFEQNLLAGNTKTLVQTAKQNNSASGYFVDQQIDGYLKMISLYLIGGASAEDAITLENAAISAAPEVTSIEFDKKTAGEDAKMYYFFQYLPYALLMMLIEGLSPILIAFRKTDLGERINCASFPQHAKNLQIGLGCMTFSFEIWLLFILIGSILYGFPQMFSANGLLCALNALIFTLIATALTLLIATFSPDTSSLSMISNILGLGMSFLCGIFVPQYFLGDAVLSVSRFLPAYWYVSITNMISGFSNEALSMDKYWMCIGVQLLFLAAIFAVYLAINQQKKRTALS